MLKEKNIVLLHGWGSCVKKLQPLARELNNLGWKVLILKMPGFDLELPSEPWGVSNYADFVLKEGFKKYKSFFILGHSFGGRVAIKIAGKNNKNISGVVLCSAAGVSKGNLFKKYFFWVFAKIGKLFILTPSFGRLWRKLLYKLAREHDYEKTSGTKREIFKKVVAENLMEDVKNNNLSTLVVWGREDRMTPVRDAYFIRRNVKGSQLKIFENVGHRLPYEKPKEIANAIERWYSNLK